MADMYMDLCIFMCINNCDLMSMCLCMCEYMYMNVCVCLTFYYGMNVINIVLKGSVYKYFTSTSAFFQSSSGMVHIDKN